MTSLCIQFKKGGCGLLWQARWGEGEYPPACRKGGGSEKADYTCYQFRVPRNLRIDIKDRLED